MHILFNSLVFLLPVSAAWIEHSASTVLALLTLLGILAWFCREQKIELTRAERSVLIAFAAFFAVRLLSVPVQSIFLENYQPNYKLGHEIRMLAFVPIYFLFLYKGLKPGTFWYGINAGAIACGIYACISIYLVETGPRVTGAYHHIVFGDTCMALAFMSLAGLPFFEKKHTLMVLIPVAAALLGLTGVFLSGSRGALVAGPLLFLVFLIQLGSRPRAWALRAALISSLLIVVVVGFVLPGTSMDKRIQSGFHTVTGYLTDGEKSFESAADPSTAARLRMWQEALKIIQSHLWIGVGEEGFENILKEKAETDPSVTPIQRFSTPHNMYLTSMTAYGIFGLATLMGIFLAPLAVLVRWIRQRNAARDFGYAGVMLVLAYMQFALTESVFGRTVPISIYLVFTAAAMALCRIHGAQERSV